MRYRVLAPARRTLGRSERQGGVADERFSPLCATKTVPNVTLFFYAAVGYLNCMAISTPPFRRQDIPYARWPQVRLSPDDV